MIVKWLREVGANYKVVLDTKQDKYKYQLQDVTKVGGRITPIYSVEIDEDTYGNRIALGSNKEIVTAGHQGANCEGDMFYNANGGTIKVGPVSDISKVERVIELATGKVHTSWTTSKVCNGKILLYVPTAEGMWLMVFDMNARLEFEFKIDEHAGRVIQGMYYYAGEYYVVSSNNTRKGLLTVYGKDGRLARVVDVRSATMLSNKNEVEGVYVDSTGVYVGIIVSILFIRDQLIVKLNV